MTEVMPTKKPKKQKAAYPFPVELIDQLLAQVENKDAESILGESGLAGHLAGHLAVLLTFLCSGFWISSPWADFAVSVLPNLLGFGVTGYAIWIGWGDERLREVLIDLEEEGKGSFYVQISAIFAHFGLAQIFALLVSFLCKAWDYELSPNSGLARVLNLFGLPTYFFSYLKPFGWGIGFFLFLYAILTALETTLALFRLATWIQAQRKALLAQQQQRNRQ